MSYENLSFNEWMAHVYRELGYPETLIQTYEQGTTREACVQSSERLVNQDEDNG